MLLEIGPNSSLLVGRGREREDLKILGLVVPPQLLELRKLLNLFAASSGEGPGDEEDRLSLPRGRVDGLGLRVETIESGRLRSDGNEFLFILPKPAPGFRPLRR
ncbi:MAG TPA: hypothetical protein VFC90_10765, partial [Planctomycetota bacterium]|nr:hypothetical protein [Planctomycetota bacterium]